MTMGSQMIYPQQKRRKQTLLLVGEETSFVQHAKFDLLRKGFLVREAMPGVENEDFSSAMRVDAVVVCSCQNDPFDSIFLLERIRSFNPEIPLFLLAQYGSEQKAVAALRSGVTDYFSGLHKNEEMARSIRHHLHDAVSAFDMKPPESPNTLEGEPNLVGVCKEMEEIRDYLTKVAGMDSTVLITGETGTGKELAADFIHWHSQRRVKPLIRINSSAMPEQLVESELFGYEKGAFTGAVASKPGKFELADGGTIFLDEIGDMSSFAQAKILRILESNQVHRLGGRQSKGINVRVITATNQDLESLIDKAQFRKDLFFRLNVARVHLPPLRDRKEDIPVLLNNFVKDFNDRFRVQVNGFSEKAWFSLLKYDWPGNIRELKNVLEATYINSPGQTITFANLPKPFQKIFTGGDFKPKSERDQVLSALFATNWNKSRAAEQLNWSRMTLYRKMAKHQIIQNRSIRTPLTDLHSNS